MAYETQEQPVITLLGNEEGRDWQSSTCSVSVEIEDAHLTLHFASLWINLLLDPDPGAIDDFSSTNMLPDAKFLGVDGIICCCVSTLGKCNFFLKEFCLRLAGH